MAGGGGRAPGASSPALPPNAHPGGVGQGKRAVNLDRAEPWLVAFDTARALRLLDLTGPWPTAAGASMAISTGLRARAQRWSRIIYAAYADLDGLRYPSSMHTNTAADRHETRIAL